jgi:hypothetical protein
MSPRKHLATVNLKKVTEKTPQSPSSANTSANNDDDNSPAEAVMIFLFCKKWKIYIF